MSVQPEKFEGKVNPGFKAWLIPAVAALVALVIGLAVGEGGGSAPSAAPAAPTVTQTVTSPPRTVTKEVASSACKDAIEKADVALMTAADGFDLASDGFGAVARMDLDALDEAVAGMRNLSPKMRSDMAAYRAAADRCR